MSQSNAQVELIIVSEADVRSYAKNQLSADQHDVIEEALLGDERAREVVQTHAPPIYELPVASELQGKLQSTLEKCKASVVSYELLSRAPGPDTVSRFAMSRFLSRWKLFDEIERATNPDNDEIASIDKLQGADIADASVEYMVSSTTKWDFQLIEALHKAFATANRPAWKAQIADWISNIEVDINQISWLAGVLPGPTAHNRPT